MDFVEKYKNFIISSVLVSYFAALYLSFLKNPIAVIIIIFPLCIGVVYSIKISNFRLKDIIGIKNISVALSWALIGTFLPVVTSSSNFVIISLIFYFFFIRVFIGSILFDARDIEGDTMIGVSTIPVILGINKTKKLLLFLNSTLILWLILSYFMGFFHDYLFVLIFSIVYSYLNILHFCREGIKIGKSLDLLVDGEWIPIVILSLLCLGH
jgi:4-hydroxybenzoate polyprenyltransferase